MEAATEMSWKKDVLINNCSESCQGKFSVKILEKYLWRSSFFVKLHYLVPESFYLRKKPAENIISRNFFIRQKPQGMQLKVADCQPATLLKMNFFIGIFQGFWLQIWEHLFSRTHFKWLLQWILCCFFMHKGNFMPTQRCNIV